MAPKRNMVGSSQKAARAVAIPISPLPPPLLTTIWKVKLFRIMWPLYSRVVPISRTPKRG